jgi:uncharacterized membrane protein
MQTEPSRAELDQVAGHYGLDAAGVDTLLELAAARPGPEARRQFLATVLRIGGILSLSAGVVFFIAANWSEIAVFGRFGLLELLLLACGVLALWRPPPAFAGRAALFLAFMTTGALLALFGQTYQTGADVHELFLGWALLGLPLAVLASWSVSSAAWLLVLNLALALFCGWHATGGILWAMLGQSRFEPATVIIGVAVINCGLWFLFERLKLEAVPGWVRRIVVSCAFAFGTWAGVLGIVERNASPLVVLVLFVMMGAVALYAHRAREDIYPLAAVLASFIVVSLVWMGDVTESWNEGMLLVMAIWLIVSSTTAGLLLASTARNWREEATT